jgi:hypothetical protein
MRACESVDSDSENRGRYTRLRAIAVEDITRAMSIAGENPESVIMWHLTISRTAFTIGRNREVTKTTPGFDRSATFGKYPPLYFFFPRLGRGECERQGHERGECERRERGERVPAVRRGYERGERVRAARRGRGRGPGENENRAGSRQGLGLDRQGALKIQKNPS